MKTLKANVFLLCLFTVISCSRQFHVAKLIPGQTYTDEAVSRLGDPDFTQFENPTKQVMVWKDVTIQAREDLITVVQRAPATYETKLQFWRQHYKNYPQQFTKIENSAEAGEHLWQLHLPSQRMNIIYDETRDTVTEVMYYNVQ